MRGFLFISNSTKPDPIVADSLDEIGPDSFSRVSLYTANQLGWELYMGINRNHPNLIKSKEFDIKFYDQHCYRNIFAISDNIKAYKNLCNYLKNNPQIEVIHCNTPIGGVVGRLAGRRFKKKIIYTAHGFHFFKGAPILYRTVFKWVEQWLARYTDVLITINNEDFEAAKNFHLKEGGVIVRVDGVGIDLTQYNDVESRDIQLDLELPHDSIIAICMGDLVKRKNFETSIRALALCTNPCLHYLICGEGNEISKLKELAKSLGVMNQVHFLGFRRDIKKLLKISNMFLFSSMQEGLPRSTMEAMAMGLPCICSDIRGNRDLIDNEKGGFLISPKNSEGFAKAITTLIENPALANEMGEYNKEKIKQFDIELVKGQMLKIFENV